MGMRQEARLRRFFGVLSYEMSFWESRCAVGAMLGDTTTVFRQWNGFRDTRFNPFGPAARKVRYSSPVWLCHPLLNAGLARRFHCAPLSSLSYFHSSEPFSVAALARLLATLRARVSKI